MSTYPKAASSRNDEVRPKEPSSILEDVAATCPSPAAVMIRRVTRRPLATCKTIASLAGFRETEVDR